ncbi:MAG TPA: pyridine nucleotide-disulfide oxidoreductase, partial [Stellaceae bacterium]|nr:pyridine nucleotide-disulfide oxidoreductase [Stellaceae bacterium]
MVELVLQHGLAFEDLYRRDGLGRLDAAFVAHLAAADAALHDRLVTARRAPDGLDKKAESDLIIALAPHLEDFIADLFRIGREVRALAAAHDALAPLYAVKRLFVQRRAVKGMTPEQAAALDPAALQAELEALIGGPLTEESFAAAVDRWMQDEAANQPALAAAARYAAWATLAPEGQKKHRRGVLFKVPHRLDMTHLVPVETELFEGVTMLKLPPEHRRRREGFALTDPGTDLTGALDQANYCIWCHEQGKDSCSRGLRDRKSGAFQKSVFGVTLAGCPL